MTNAEKIETFNAVITYYAGSDKLINKLKEPFRKAAVDMNRKFEDVVEEYAKCHNQIVKLSRLHNAVESILNKFEEKEKMFVEEYIIKNKTGFKVAEMLGTSHRSLMKLQQKAINKFFRLANFNSYDFQQMLGELHEGRII